jgi:hypothetical protein
LYQNEDPLYNANLEFQPFVFIGYIDNQNRNDITQSRFIKTNKLDSRLDYYYVLTPKVNLNFTLANSYVYQSLDSSIFQRLDNGTINNLTDSKNTNYVGYRFNDSSLGFHIKWLTGKFTFTPGVTLHRFNLTNSQLAINTKQELTRFLPDFRMIYQIKKSESLTYNYALTNNFTNVNNFALGTIFNSYNSLFSGNRNLENSVVHSHTLNYQKFNMFNFENFGGFINYTRTTEAVKTRALFDGVNQEGSPFNSPFGDENLSGNFRYGRSFLKYYKANFSANLKGVFGSQYNFQRASISVSDRYRQNPIGYIDYMFEIGKIWGKVPYPLLNLHPGNETYAYDSYSFNLMNYFEFGSDKYIIATATHHFDGFFLNKFPLIKKLKWRELVSTKVVWGDISNMNKTTLIMPKTLSSLRSKPYVELGAGIENIFKILRIDAMWRLTYINSNYVKEYEKNSPSKISKFGIRATLQFGF